MIERSPEDVFAFFDDRANDQRWLSSVTESHWLDPQETTRVGRRGRSVIYVWVAASLPTWLRGTCPGRLVEHRQVSDPFVMETLRALQNRMAQAAGSPSPTSRRGFPRGPIGWLAAPFAAQAGFAGCTAATLLA